MLVKRIKYKDVGHRGRPVESMTLAGIGRTLTSDYNTEILEGVVQEKKASAGEERFARGLNAYEKVGGYQFRMAVGAGRNMPGWKELDYLVWDKIGMYYAVEVDTAFTHRNKQNADILHDAILRKELAYLNLYPTVFHVDGERDLADQKTTDETIRRLF